MKSFNFCFLFIFLSLNEIGLYDCCSSRSSKITKYNQHLQNLQNHYIYPEYPKPSNFSIQINVHKLAVAVHITDLVFNNLGCYLKAGFGHITQLFLERNNLNEKSLKSILDRCKTSSHPRSHLTLLNHMWILSLSQNNFEHLSFELISLLKISKLKWLDVSYNKLKSISDKLIVNLKYLMFLNLSNNQLTNISFNDSERTKLIYMIELDLSNNYLQSIHYKIFEIMPLLKVLRLNKNNLKFLNSSMLPKNLRECDLSDNPLISIHPSTFKGMHLLEYLRLNNVSMTNSLDISFMHSVTSKIYSIELRNNNLKELGSSFKGKDCLVELDLSSNNISQLQSKDFKDLKSLKELNLRDNRISYVHDDVISMLNSVELRRFDFEDNDCTFIIETILEVNRKNISEVNQYYKIIEFDCNVCIYF